MLRWRAGTEAGEANTVPFADEAEQSDVKQSWPGLFWLPPADDEPGACDMLHLDDELAGLIEAADPSAAQAETHPIKPGPASAVLGELALAHMMSAAAVSISHFGRCAICSLAYCCMIFLHCVVSCNVLLCSTCKACTFQHEVRKVLFARCTGCIHRGQ